MKTTIFSTILLCVTLSGCATSFVVNSEPLQSEVFIYNSKSGEKKTLGKTPLKLTMSEVQKVVAEDVNSGEYFKVSVEKNGFVSESFLIPSTRFGTMVTTLTVKLKSGESEKEARIARDILNHLFLAQKLALTKQYERAQVELDKILADFPAFARALSMRASIYFAQNNFTESLKWYEEALKADPQMEDAVRMAAKVRSLQGGGRAPASRVKP
jgi:tetratricopeptide (TPR) repeat protein